MLVVDPMHNLFLGTAKHILKSVRLNRAILEDCHFELIQERVYSAVVPSRIGRLPLKIRSGFAFFTADQWKNWVNYFSLLTLRGFLLGDDLECWRHFVLACRILTKNSLSQTEVVLADALLQFCKQTESLYGKGVITPNMHMHCHIRSCIEVYGPVHGFWLFAFERYNGILGRVPNNRSIEMQVMNRFSIDGVLRRTELPSEYRKEFEQCLYADQTKHIGSLADSMRPTASVSSAREYQWSLGNTDSVQIPESIYVD